MAPQKPSPLKKFIKKSIACFQYLLAFAILWLIWGKLGKAWDQIQSAEYVLQFNGFWMAASFFFYLLSLPFPASYWHCVLRQLGQKPTLRSTIRAHLIGHLGKYVPGKIFVVLIRSGLLKGPNVDATVCVLSIFLEGLMQMAVGALVMATLFIFWSSQMDDARFLWGSLLLFVMTGCPILPPIFKLAVKLIGMKKFSHEVNKVDLLSWKTFLFGIPLMIGYWLLLGLSLWCVLLGVGLELPFCGVYPIALLAITASMTVGFVIVIAPGGMGVREAIIVILMAPLLKNFTNVPDAAALVSACVLRILWIVAELFCAGFVYFTLPGRKMLLSNKVDSSEEAENTAENRIKNRVD